MSKKVSPKKEANKMDPVSAMMTMNQSINKELSALRLYQHFDINHPEKLDTFPDKPQANRILLKEHLDKGRTIRGTEDKVIDMQLEENLSEEMKTKLSKFGLKPVQKYTKPQTYSQEIGWFTNQNGPKSSFDYKRGSCKETTYAKQFYEMMGISPFSKKNK